VTYACSAACCASPKSAASSNSTASSDPKRRASRKNDLFAHRKRVQGIPRRAESSARPCIDEAQAEGRAICALRCFATRAAGQDRRAWDAIANAQQVYRDIETQYSEIEHARAFCRSYFAYARQLVRGARNALSGRGRLPEFRRFATCRSRTTSAFHCADLPEYESLRLGWSLTKCASCSARTIHSSIWCSAGSRPTRSARH